VLRIRIALYYCGATKRALHPDGKGRVELWHLVLYGQGKSKGYRTIVVLRRGAKAFFVYAKSQRANIDDAEKQQFKEVAKHLLGLTEKQLAELLKRGDFMEVRSE
jgi:hypothetical protein